MKNMYCSAFNVIEQIRILRGEVSTHVKFLEGSRLFLNSYRLAQTFNSVPLSPLRTADTLTSLMLEGALVFKINGEFKQNVSKKCSIYASKSKNCAEKGVCKTIELANGGGGSVYFGHKTSHRETLIRD